MTTIEITYRPTPNTIERKNTKSALSHTIYATWNAIQDCTDEATKDKIIKILMAVL